MRMAQCLGLDLRAFSGAKFSSKTTEGHGGKPGMIAHTVSFTKPSMEEKKFDYKK